MLLFHSSLFIAPPFTWAIWKQWSGLSFDPCDKVYGYIIEYRKSDHQCKGYFSFTLFVIGIGRFMDMQCVYQLFLS